MAKTLAEIQEGLSKTYDGPTYEKNGFTFIPWNEAVKVANRVFDIDGYDIITEYVVALAEGYEAKVVVTVYPSDGRPFRREGIGFNELTGTNGRAHDTAVKGAPSDALNRALKLFGPAFGLNLYDKSDSAGNGRGQSRNSYPTIQTLEGQAPRGGTATPATDAQTIPGLMSRAPFGPKKADYIGNVSPAQAVKAREAGWSDAALARLEGGEVRTVMDGVFGKGPKIMPPADARAPEPAEIPF